MNHRHRLYYAVIAVLLFANLGRWAWLSRDAAGLSAREERALQPGDFQLRLPAAAAPTQARRDLFRPAGEAQPAPSVRPTVATAAPAPLPPAVVEDRLGRLRLLGVVLRGGRAQAYLALDKHNTLAHAGDTVFERFVVERIDVDAVVLRSRDDDSSRKISISGK